MSDDTEKKSENDEKLEETISLKTTEPDTEAAKQAVELAAIEYRAVADSPVPPTPVALPKNNDTSVAKPWLREPDQHSKSKKSIIILVAVLLIAIFAGASSWAAYALWYQNPEKVVTDGITSAIKAKTMTAVGDASIDTEWVSVKLSVDTKATRTSGSDFDATIKLTVKDLVSLDLSGEVIYAPNGDVYFKAKDITKAYDKTMEALIKYYSVQYSDMGATVTPKMLDAVRAQYEATYKPILVKIDNKWVKLSAEDISKTDKTRGDEYECTQKAWKKHESNSKTMNEISAAYVDNRFIVIQENLGVQAGSMGYVIDINDAKAQAFVDALKKTAVYQDLKNCSEDFEKAIEPEKKRKNDTETTQRVELWLDQWTHQITHFNAVATVKDDGKQTLKMNADFALTFDEPLQISPPKDSIPFSEIRDDIQKIIVEQTAAAAISGGSVL